MTINTNQALTIAKLETANTNLRPAAGKFSALLFVVAVLLPVVAMVLR